jgi:hypothetical protein
VSPWIGGGRYVIALFPRMPWHSLAAIHALFAPAYRREHVSVCRGYVEF